MSDEATSLRRWLLGSLAIHGLLIIFLTTLRFSPTLEQPLQSYEVSLVNPSDFDTPQAKSQPQTKARVTSQAKASRPKAKPVTPPKPKAPPPPQPVPKAPPPPPPPPAPKSQPAEPKLAPLPTQAASERLSDSFAGAVKSVVVPEKLSAHRQQTPIPLTPSPTEPDTPNALEDIKLPTSAPKLARPQRLEPQTRVTIPTPPPQSPPPSPQAATTKPTPTPKLPSPSVQEETAKALQALKAPPEAPTLKSIQPFKRTRRKEDPTPQTEKLSESLRKSIQSVKVPKARVKSINKISPKTPESTVPPTQALPTPEAPQLARVTPSRQPVQEPPPKQERLADSLKEVLGTVKIPKLRKTPITKRQPSQPTQQVTPPPQASESSTARQKNFKQADTSRAQSLKSEIDEQLAKLTIPEVAPIESLKERLQVQVQAAPDAASGSGSSTARNSAGQNRYLALIEAKIEQEWVAPRVSLAEDHPQVILKFRVLSSGEVTDLGIQQSSGNGYYDAAAKRAVRAASPLPPFPKDLDSSYLDLLYKFRIGESLS
ncbi:MAG: TonB family protein [Nitrospirales bacterium]|nr:TonB family protein [Nitrospira sp.]MDR4501194.1 TonB family protein [Nitrospirales bacterium]